MPMQLWVVVIILEWLRNIKVAFCLFTHSVVHATLAFKFHIIITFTPGNSAAPLRPVLSPYHYSIDSTAAQWGAKFCDRGSVVLLPHCQISSTGLTKVTAKRGLTRAEEVATKLWYWRASNVVKCGEREVHYTCDPCHPRTFKWLFVCVILKKCAAN